ncbi:hypothetical protein BGZ61DRAFT_364340, partial [Ilyonectria robusta]|uniref:uncharacterized protein n=1 Tax=Ilyonectria robusta TaxID=1079257 RepID=UPI001E8EBEF9
KCDRQRPCGNCQTRGHSSTCAYSPNTPVHPPRPPTSASSSLVQRLNKLENLLTSLVQPEDQQEPGSTYEIRQSRTEPSALSDSGSMLFDSNGPIHVHGSHWSAILDGIAELRSCLNEHNNMPTIQQPSKGPLLFAGCHESISKQQILASMPERNLVDILVFRYFNMHLPGDHSLEEYYETFWANPSAVSLPWLAILYSILCLRTLSSSGAQTAAAPEHDAMQCQSPQPKFLQQTVQCLVLGDYSRGGPDVIEALMHYLAIEFVRQPDAEVGKWMLSGIIIRLALRMGYHREPSRFPGITAFQCEIRRRVWCFLYVIDTISSIQMGMPRMIKDGQWDTESPRNLYDDDFDEDVESLPPSRPETEVAPMLFLQSRHKLVSIIAAVWDTNLSIADKDGSFYTKSNHLGGLLQQTYDSFSAGLKFDNLSDCLSNTAHDIAHRLSLAILLQKGRLPLYRQHLSEWESSTCAKSVDACLEAAMKLLEYHSILYAETQPDASLVPVRWILSSVVAHEFLMATTVLCTYLYRKASSLPVGIQGEDDERCIEIELALSKAREIWVTQVDRSSEARKAVDMLEKLFKKLHGAEGMDDRQVMSFPMSDLISLDSELMYYFN